jgi:hypothetical protein
VGAVNAAGDGDLGGSAATVAFDTVQPPGSPQTKRARREGTEDEDDDAGAGGYVPPAATPTATSGGRASVETPTLLRLTAEALRPVFEALLTSNATE